MGALVSPQQRDRSFVLIVLADAYLIRRANALRFLFGMRPLARGAMPRAATSEA